MPRQPADEGADPRGRRLTFDKEEGALRTIGEVERLLGIKPHVLRYWEQQFPSLEPLKRAGGRRYYRPADINLLKRIDRMVNREGYTIKGARAALEGSEEISPATENGKPDNQELITRLHSIRNLLRQALD